MRFKKHMYLNKAREVRDNYSGIMFLSVVLATSLTSFYSCRAIKGEIKARANDANYIINPLYPTGERTQ